MNNKLKQTLVLGLAVLLTLTATSIGLATQQQTVYASTEEEQCSTIPSTDPDLKGWEIETCSDDGDQTWITPDGRRCAAGEKTTMCEGSIPIAPSS